MRCAIHEPTPTSSGDKGGCGCRAPGNRDSNRGLAMALLLGLGLAVRLSSKSGLAWKSQVTPMADFPVQNNNAHARPILAALRIAGITAPATGLDIDPHVSVGDFALRSQLVELSRQGKTLSGVYRPSGDAARTLVVHAAGIASASQDGKPVSVTPGATSVTFQLDTAPDRQTHFEVVEAP